MSAGIQLRRPAPPPAEGLAARPDGAPAARLDEHLVALVAPDSFDAEPYRILLGSLERLRGARSSLALAVTSAMPGDGKTTTSINLAATLARLPGARVLLLDADLRRPSVAGRLGLADWEGLGLGRALRRPERVATEALAPCPPLPLAVLAASRQDELRVEDLQAPSFAAVIQAAREAYRYVVIDTPPVVALPDARALAELVDGFLVVVRAGATPRELLAEALEALAPERVLGLVFNGDERPYAGYYGRYRSYYHARGARAAGGRR